MHFREGLKHEKFAGYNLSVPEIFFKLVNGSRHGGHNEAIRCVSFTTSLTLLHDWKAQPERPYELIRHVSGCFPVIGDHFEPRGDRANGLKAKRIAVDTPHTCTRSGILFACDTKIRSCRQLSKLPLERIISLRYVYGSRLNYDILDERMTKPLCRLARLISLLPRDARL